MEVVQKCQILTYHMRESADNNGNKKCEKQHIIWEGGHKHQKQQLEELAMVACRKEPG